MTAINDLPDNNTSSYTRIDHRRYRQKVRRCLDVLAAMLADSAFDEDKRMIGLELEIDLVDEDRDPAMRNAEFLARHGDDLWKAELGQFNLELNAAPRLIAGEGLAEYERELLDRLSAARR